MAEPFQCVRVPVITQIPLPVKVIDARDVFRLHSLYHISTYHIISLIHSNMKFVCYDEITYREGKT